MLVVPRLRIDGLANTAEDPQTAQIVTLNMVRSEMAQKMNSGGCRVELSELIFVDSSEKGWDK